MIRELRTYKLFDVILFDNVATIVASMWLSQKLHKPFPLILIGMYLLSVIVHYLFKIDTKTLRYVRSL